MHTWTERAKGDWHRGRVGVAHFPQNRTPDTSTPNSAPKGLRHAESILCLESYFEARPEAPATFSPFGPCSLERSVHE